MVTQVFRESEAVNPLPEAVPKLAFAVGGGLGGSIGGGGLEFC